MNAEQLRLDADRQKKVNWRKWGPYLSERQWGTVREDYSANGDAWNYFPHDAARSRAYRWGEDGIAGFCDDEQQLCLGIALWNGRDHILKERLFGLSNREGNHGEDVKEIYYYLDATPTHSYLKMLYKYPQREFPYRQLIDENARRGKFDREYELIDTGIFAEDRYFDVVVEYAKATPDDVLIQVTISNRGPEAATLHVLPQMWYRNTWSWSVGAPRPSMRLSSENAIQADHGTLGRYWLHSETPGRHLFCENETDGRHLGWPSAPGFYKDAFHELVVNGNESAVNPRQVGTKTAIWYSQNIEPGSDVQFRLRLSNAVLTQPFDDFQSLLVKRRQEADEFYGQLQRRFSSDDARSIQRQAFAGLIWSKQYYNYNIREWLTGDPSQPSPPPERISGRNHDWLHLNAADVVMMPDKWEYPWFAAWDLAFQCVAMARIDAEFAKSQLLRIVQPWYLHATGQMPAYEWDFDDANPPVHGWAAMRVFQIDRKWNGHPGDYKFLERMFHMLLLNFTWWINRKDAQNRNLFQGGFLGLDNIGIIDRDQPLPQGGVLDQADGTAWMAMYCLNLMRIALELSKRDPSYQDIATKFFEHFLQIAEAMAGSNIFGSQGLSLWDEQEGMYFSAASFPNGERFSIRVHSLVGLIPLFAVETLEPELIQSAPRFQSRLLYYLEHRTDLASLVSHWNVPGRGERRLLSLLRGHRMKALLRHLLDETEFLSDFGVRALSKVYRDSPYHITAMGNTYTIEYEPGESTTDMFGGNSNWRGPIWFPVNYLIIESLQKFHHYYGDDFKVECPTHSAQYLTILEVSRELTRRLSRIFLKDNQGRRAVFGDCDKFQSDPNFCDYIPFYEYFHGDTGRGVGASHQTGWTALIAKLLQTRD